MKTKLLFGLAATSAAGLFWACGSGEIIEFADDDNNQFVMYDYAIGSEDVNKALQGMVQQAITDYCTANNAGPDCNEALQPGGAAIPQAQSSSSLGYKPINKDDELPNNQGNQNNQGQPSSNITVVDPGSNGGQGSNQNPTSNPSTPTSAASSASTPAVQSATSTGGAAWATCSIVGKNVVKKGSAVVWKGQAQVGGAITMQTMMQLKYDWVFEGGNPPSASGGIELKMDTVTYANSGTYQTSLTLTTPSGEKQTISCPALEVTGADITGCKCTAASKTADISEDVNWTVSGCTSEDPTFTYAWSEPFQIVTSAVANGKVPSTGVYKPTVTVKNADNGMMEVTCDEVKVTDRLNPEYELKVEDGKVPQDKISVADGGCISVSGKWTNANYTPSLSVSCDVTGTGAVSLNIVHGTETKSGSGQYSINNVALPLGTMSVGDISFENICIKVTGATSASCGLAN